MYRRWLKRWLDVALAVAGLVVLSPLMLLVAATIKATDPGPIIFVQRRVGANGRSFAFYKFRSMPWGTPEMTSDQVADLRLTAIGRLIRRTSIDELPQLINVLRGDMSLVGPRPPIESQAGLIALRRQSGALACRPGLSGLAQVNSFDNMTVEEKAALDGEYARRLSFGLDVSILLRTVTYLFKPPPKY
jgi:O-antigen biosynthesis protein WbqP